MSGERFVRTKAIKAVVAGRETAVLDKLGIKWRDSRPHLRCPYPEHVDANPSWRWDQDRAQAICTCVARNAYRGGSWRLLRDLARALREQPKLLP